MPQEQIVNPEQKSAYESPWSDSHREMRALWGFCWFLFCAWTPKPLNPWRLFWLRVFDAKIHGTPFVHQRARIAVEAVRSQEDLQISQQVPDDKCCQNRSGRGHHGFFAYGCIPESQGAQRRCDAG